MNVIAYMRISTEQQDSIDTQRAAINRYCEYNDLTIVGEYVEAQSGSTIDRPQLQAALARLGTDCSGLVVYKADRLSRSLKDLLTLLDTYFKTHRLHAVVDKLDTSTAMGTAFAQLTGVFSELERSTLIERTRAGLRHRKATGMTYCRRLYGYSTASGEAMHAIPAEQRVLKTIMDLRRRKHSFQEIADWLNAQGIDPPNKGKWHKGTVHRICGRQT